MKKIFWYFLSVFVVVVVISLVVVIDKKFTVEPVYRQDEKEEKLARLNHIDKRIDYFHYDYLDRYPAFQEKNPTLEEEDIITRVNLNLDYPYYENTKQSNFLNKVNILVNKYIYLPKDYVPNNLAEISSSYAGSGKQLVYEAKEKFEQMADSAKKEGLTIRAISAYRSYQYQENLYNRYLQKDTREKVDTYSARPGHSEHQTGLVVDVDNTKVNFEEFESTLEFEWMKQHAHEFGFILRYPKGKENLTGYTYESWHYRYVGEAIAKYIYENKITLDEYYARFIDK